MPVPDWLTVGTLVTLPDLDNNRTAKYGHRYRVVHVKPSASMRSGTEVGVQPVDALELKKPKCVDMDHCARVVVDVAPEYQLPRILA